MAEGSPSGGQSFEIRVLAELVLPRGWEGKICSMPPSWLLAASATFGVPWLVAASLQSLPASVPTLARLPVLFTFFLSDSAAFDLPHLAALVQSRPALCDPQTAARQAPLCSTISQSLLKLTSIELFHSFIKMYSKDMYLLYYAFIYLTNQIQCCRSQLQWHKNFILTTHLNFDMTGRSTGSIILKFSDEETGAPAFKQCRGL